MRFCTHKLAAQLTQRLPAFPLTDFSVNGQIFLLPVTLTLLKSVGLVRVSRVQSLNSKSLKQ